MCGSAEAALIVRQLLGQRGSLRQQEDSEEWLLFHRSLWLASTAIQPQDYDQVVQSVYRESTHAEFRRECAYHWVRCCLDSRPAVEYHFTTRQIDREKDVRRAVLQDKRLSELVSLDRQVDRIGEGYLATLIDWFLRRYDLLTAIGLMRFYWRARSWGVRRWTRELSRQLRVPGNSLLLGVVLFLLGWLAWSYRAAVCDVLGAYERLALHIASTQLLTILLAALYPSILCLGVFSLWWRGSVWFKVLLPRMMAGIVVGYLPLLLTEEAWMMVHRMHRREGLLLVAGALGFSWYYLFVEVQNTVREKLVAAVRASRVFSMGVLESFLIGAIVQDLTAQAFLPEEIPGDVLQPCLMGSIYPKVLYVYFPLALLIGIFVQIIWEDKPITEPL